jgi:hypothetical protein
MNNSVKIRANKLDGFIFVIESQGDVKSGGDAVIITKINPATNEGVFQTVTESDYFAKFLDEFMGNAK